MNRHRSWPLLLVAFGTLIALIAVSGVGALRRARQTYREVSALDDRYRTTARVLNEVGSDISLAGLLARDYLLDPSAISSAGYRAQLVQVRSRMESALKELAQVIRHDEIPSVEKLQQEVEGYWDVLDPLFEWTPEEKQARSWTFLRREVLRRREIALSIAGEIHDLTKANLVRERQDVDREQADMQAFIERMLAVTVLLGLMIAAVSIFRMTRLEHRADEQRKRTEAAEDELRLLSRQLVRAQEQERKSISRELHDEIGQMLTALRMELRSLQELRGAPPEQFEEHLDDAKRLTEQSLRAVRDMAMGLRPSMLDDLGLGSALQWQARQFSKHAGVPVNVQIEGALTSLPERHRTCIYRVVQEALTNCARHARAHTIGVAIVRGERQLRVTVRDDGAGFDPSATRGRGLGLIGMQERIKELGGELKLRSLPQHGTVLSAVIPLPEAGAEGAA
ncbi:MAG TPA: sensor histidine kinase [Bryobacteraceae bacterium]